MSWVDNVLATPTIGVRIDTKLTSMSVFRDSFDSLFEYLREKYEAVEIKSTEIWGHIISPKNKSGFRYAISPNNIVVSYDYFVAPKKLSGRFPSLELPELQLYSNLLYQNLSEIEQVFMAMQAIKDFTYNRIGIVLDSNLSKDIFPPGLLTFVKYLGKPWGDDIKKIELNRLLAKLSESENEYDQCHHAIILDESDPDKEINFKLDWQRVYKNSLPFDIKTLSLNLTSCINLALRYFDKFGAGDLKYE